MRRVLPAGRPSTPASAVSEAADAPERLVLVSASAFALAVVLNPVPAALLAVAGTASLGLSFTRRGQRLALAIPDRRVGAVLLSVAVVAVLVRPAVTAPLPWWVSGALPAVAGVLMMMELASRWVRRHVALAAAVLVLTGLATGVLIVRSAAGSGYDTVLLHRAAAAALAEGQNPYGDAVWAPDGAPGASPSSRIVGYSYPPVVAVSYALGTWVGGDPRWTTLVAWLALLSSAAAIMAHASEKPRSSALPLLLLAALPGGALMLQSGWTEMLSAALLGLALPLPPVPSGIALGLALASKQYFIVAAPLLVLLYYRGEGRRQRMLAAAGAALVALAPAFFRDSEAAWAALVRFHGQTALRPDSSNLAGILAAAGLPWAPPNWAALAASSVVLLALARQSGNLSGLYRALACGLAVLFLLSRQAMPNYWYLVAAASVLGSLPDGSTRRVGRGTGVPRGPLVPHGSSSSPERPPHQPAE